MPAVRMGMQLSTSDYARQLKAYKIQQAASGAANPRSGLMMLTSPMVSRIHNIKPGCSACGK
jgi:hypothetical protein